MGVIIFGLLFGGKLCKHNGNICNGFGAKAPASIMLPDNSNIKPRWARNYLRRTTPRIYNSIRIRADFTKNGIEHECSFRAEVFQIFDRNHA